MYKDYVDELKEKDRAIDMANNQDNWFEVSEFYDNVYSKLFQDDKDEVIKAICNANSHNYEEIKEMFNPNARNDDP